MFYSDYLFEATKAEIKETQSTTIRMWRISLLHAAPQQLRRHKEKHHHNEPVNGPRLRGGPVGSARQARRGGAWGGGGGSGAEEKSQNVFACSPAGFCLLERSRMKRRRSPDRIRAAPLEDRSWNCELSLGHASMKPCDANAGEPPTLAKPRDWLSYSFLVTRNKWLVQAL